MIDIGLAVALLLIVGLLTTLFPRTETRAGRLTLGFDIVALVVVTIAGIVPGVPHGVYLTLAVGLFIISIIVFLNLVRVRFQSGRYRLPW